MCGKVYSGSRNSSKNHCFNFWRFFSFFAIDVQSDRLFCNETKVIKFYHAKEKGIVLSAQAGEWVKDAVVTRPDIEIGWVINDIPFIIF